MSRNTKDAPSSDRNRDRHSPGYMREYMRRRRAKQNLSRGCDEDFDRQRAVDMACFLTAAAWREALSDVGNEEFVRLLVTRMANVINDLMEERGITRSEQDRLLSTIGDTT